MTHTRSAVAAALLALSAAPGLAQGFAGAEISAGTSLFEDGSDLGSATYGFGLEFGLTPRIGVSAELSWHGFGALGVDARSAALHGLYRFDMATIGAFVGQEATESSDATFYGLEALTTLGPADVEAYLLRAEGGSFDGSGFGLEGRFDIGRNLGARASLDLAEMDREARRIAIGGEYRLAGGPVLHAEIGQLDLDGDGSAFIGIGATLGLGQGVTFGRRALSDLIPDF